MEEKFCMDCFKYKPAEGFGFDFSKLIPKPVCEDCCKKIAEKRNGKNDTPG
jgi:hypothetical protein